MRVWFVPGLDEYGLGFKTSLSGGAFMEEQIFLFPLPVEKLRTEFFWKMNSFPCCLFWMLYWGKVQRYHSTFFWHQKFPVFFAFVLSSQAGKHTHGHEVPLVCPLPWNCHRALATKWFCGKWSVGIRAGPSICCKSQVLWACWFAELISKHCWSLWLHTAHRYEWCLQSTVRNTVQSLWNYSLWN